MKYVETWGRGLLHFLRTRLPVLLTGGPEARTAIESGEGLADWIASWRPDEERFRDERRAILLYSEDDSEDEH